MTGKNIQRQQTFITEFAKDGRNTSGIQTAELEAAYLDFAIHSFS